MDYSILFPEPEEARDDGLLAVGGDLKPARLINAYANGIFPWYSPGQEILWWCPKPRFVIFPNEINISGSMKKFIRKTTLYTKINSNFAGVINNCRMLRINNTWLTDEMVVAYNVLHRMGYALSVEVYEQRSESEPNCEPKPSTEPKPSGEPETHGKSESGCNPETLVGGLYGVVLGKCFFGESMFSLVPNASKLALIELCSVLSSMGFVFVDCQFHTEHLEKMGGRYISWEEYKKLLLRGRGTYDRYYF
jgi:leucyl/phenylalanyl-tRNA--protein transferase